MFGRLTRLAVDLIAISTIIAGIKKTTGFTPTTNRVKDASIRSFIESYLGLGETVFGMICGFAYIHSHTYTYTYER